MFRVALTLLALSCAGCVMGIPDAGPAPPPKRETCQIWVRIDDGPWRCYERRRTLRDLCKITGC